MTNGKPKSGVAEVPAQACYQADEKPYPPVRGRWKPGQSGNLAGVSKSVAEVRHIVQGHAAECVALLLDAARQGNVDAMKYLIDQSCGKSKDRIEIEAGSTPELMHLARAELVAHVKALQAKAKEPPLLPSLTVETP